MEEDLRRKQRPKHHRKLSNVRSVAVLMGNVVQHRVKQCNYCHKVGHFISVCHKRMKKADDVQVEPQGTYEVEEPTSYWFDTVETLDVINTAPCTIMLPIGGSQVKYKVDTGADVTLMDANTYKSLPQKPPISPTNAKLMSPGGRVACLGEFVAHVPFKDKKYNFKVGRCTL